MKTYLGFDKDRTNPNRLKQGVLSVADQNENKVEVVDRGPSKLGQALDIGKKIAVVLVLIAGTLLGLHVEGTLILPKTLVGILTALTGIGAALGIGSGGIKQKSAEPKIGPPAE